MAYTATMSGYGRAPASTTTGTTYLNTLGFGDLLDTSKKNIEQLLSGLPSAGPVKTANAYFGAASGLGAGSDFLRNRGYDLYGQKAEGYRQLGNEALNRLIGTVTGPELGYRGQNIENEQFGAQLGENRRQFNVNQELQQFLAQLQAIGLGLQMGEAGYGGGPGGNQQPGTDVSWNPYYTSQAIDSMPGYRMIRNPDGTLHWLPA